MTTTLSAGTEQPGALPTGTSTNIGKATLEPWLQEELSRLDIFMSSPMFEEHFSTSEIGPLARELFSYQRIIQQPGNDARERLAYIESAFNEHHQCVSELRGAPPESIESDQEYITQLTNACKKEQFLQALKSAHALYSREQTIFEQLNTRRDEESQALLNLFTRLHEAFSAGCVDKSSPFRCNLFYWYQSFSQQVEKFLKGELSFSALLSPHARDQRGTPNLLEIARKNFDANCEVSRAIFAFYQKAYANLLTLESKEAASEEPRSCLLSQLGMLHGAITENDTSAKEQYRVYPFIYRVLISPAEPSFTELRLIANAERNAIVGYVQAAEHDQKGAENRKTLQRPYIKGNYQPLSSQMVVRRLESASLASQLTETNSSIAVQTLLHVKRLIIPPCVHSPIDSLLLARAAASMAEEIFAESFDPTGDEDNIRAIVSKLAIAFDAGVSADTQAALLDQLYSIEGVNNSIAFYQAYKTLVLKVRELPLTDDSIDIYRALLQTRLVVERLLSDKLTTSQRLTEEAHLEKSVTALNKAMDECVSMHGSGDTEAKPEENELVLPAKPSITESPKYHPSQEYDLGLITTDQEAFQRALCAAYKDFCNFYIKLVGETVFPGIIPESTFIWLRSCAKNLDAYFSQKAIDEIRVNRDAFTTNITRISDEVITSLISHHLTSELLFGVLHALAKLHHEKEGNRTSPSHAGLLTALNERLKEDFNSLHPQDSEPDEHASESEHLWWGIHQESKELYKKVKDHIRNHQFSAATAALDELRATLEESRAIHTAKPLNQSQVAYMKRVSARCMPILENHRRTNRILRAILNFLRGLVLARHAKQGNYHLKGNRSTTFQPRTATRVQGIHHKVAKVATVAARAG